MRSYGLTKARSMGPVADFVRRAGGSLARVFRQAELPMALLDDPERLMLLKDQLLLVECAVREVGDVALTARLSTEAGFATLGVYGHQVEAAPTLGESIASASAMMGTLLQASTHLSLEVSGPEASWTYRVTEQITVGRRSNEILALGYMLDLMRQFAGGGWSPSRLELPSGTETHAAVEDVLRANMSRGRTAAVVFPANLLECPNRRFIRRANPLSVQVPDPNDVVTCVERLISLDLLEEHPNLQWMCRRLAISPRSLQRQLAARGTRFETLVRRVLQERACELLRSGASATTIACELGYSDLAHFTRAFRRWTGRSPRTWRDD